MKKIAALVFALACCHAFASGNSADGVWQINNGSHKGVDIITTLVVDTSSNTSAMCPHDASSIIVGKLKNEGGKVIAINPIFGFENTITIEENTLVLGNGDKWQRALIANINKKCIAALNAKGFLTRR